MRTCDVVCDGKRCGGKTVARGWCGKHYQRWKAHGDPLPPSRPTVCTIEGCGEHHGRGWCDEHWKRWSRTGDPLGSVARVKRDPAERFWAKVDIDGPVMPGMESVCFEWLAAKNEAGYGLFGVASSRCRGAHIVAWQFRNGPVPAGGVLDHVCRNPGCVRIDHLRLTDAKGNAENRAGANRNNRSGVRGVAWCENTGRWIARVGHNYKLIQVGRFDTLAEAEAAVKAARRRIFTHSEMDKLAAPTEPEQLELALIRGDHAA